MMNHRYDRRAALSANAHACVVRQALHIQDDLGTIGAVEYLKGRAVAAAVIRRVLSSAQTRATDRAIPAS